MAVGPAPTLGGRRVSDAARRGRSMGFSRHHVLSIFELALVLLVVGKVQCLVGGANGLAEGCPIVDPGVSTLKINTGLTACITSLVILRSAVMFVYALVR